MTEGQKQPKSFKSLSAKLDEDKVEEIYVELREGTSLTAIAKMFDVSHATIQNVNSGKYFKVPDVVYPIVDRSHKYGKEPRHEDEFWDAYWPESPINLGGLK
jgi:transposase